MRDVLISIVSHGHVEMVERLVDKLISQDDGNIKKIIITFNVPERNIIINNKNQFIEIEYIFNNKAFGFSLNHNKALKNEDANFYCILNPDVELLENGDIFSSLKSSFLSKDIACVYPIQVDEHGVVQDCERELPSPYALWRRCVLRRPQSHVDWVNAAFILVPATKWHAVGGFDTRYFMYCEDVDLCLRLQLQGGKLCRTEVQVLHRGERASSKKIQHFRWHLHSLLRLWTSFVFWQYLCRNWSRSSLNS